MITQEPSVPHATPATGTTARKRLSDKVVAAGGVALVSLTGFLTAFYMPHGPATAAQVWLVMAGTLAIGLIGGLALRTRWALPALPLVYILTVELTRLNVVGPTVDAIRLDNAFGILALIVGRGFHGMVALLPMVVGIGFGLTLAPYLPGAAVAPAVTPLRALGQQPVLLLLALVVLGLAVANGIPASTPPIVDNEGQTVPGSIAELVTVRLGGHDQAILVRGHSSDLPVLLYLSGGPGQSDLPYSRVLLADLTETFVVVSWDQRGTGKSYAALDPTATLTPAQAVADTLALTNYLRDRFDEEKIYLLGESWGSTLAVLAAQQRPELYHAVIGSGQMVSQRATDRQLYRDVLALAAQTGDTALAEQMRSFGEPPYGDVPYPNAVVMGYYPRLEQPYMPPQAYIERGSAANLGFYGILGSEYNLVEKVNVLRGLIDMFTVMYPQLQAIDFRRDVPRLEVPLYLLDGKAELAARRDLALAWYEMLEAPIKRLYTFDNAAHSVAFEQYAALQQIFTETILPETYPTRSVAP
jgi:pimeloyl-ACP methyl ester carboxylesterase